MPFCLVPDCKNDSNYTKGTGISYHRLPLDEKLPQQWLEKTKRANPPNLSFTSINSALNALTNSN